MKEQEKRKDQRLNKFWRWFDERVGAGFQAKADAVSTIYPEEVEDRLAEEDFVLIDTRESDQYRQEHVKGAINIPLDAMIEDPGVLVPYQDKSIALVCNTGSTTALFGAIYLAENGFEVFNLDQGIQGWISSGGETESG